MAEIGLRKWHKNKKTYCAQRQSSVSTVRRRLHSQKMGKRPQGRQAKARNGCLAERETMRKFKEKDLTRANKERAVGLSELKKHGVSVFKESEERESETSQE